MKMDGATGFIFKNFFAMLNPMISTFVSGNSAWIRGNTSRKRTRTIDIGWMICPTNYDNASTVGKFLLTLDL